MRIIKHPELRLLPPNTTFARYNPATRQCSGLYTTRANGAIGVVLAIALAPQQGLNPFNWVPRSKDLILPVSEEGQTEVEVPFSAFEPTGFYAVLDPNDPQCKGLMVYTPATTPLGLTPAPNGRTPSPLFPSSK